VGLLRRRHEDGRTAVHAGRTWWFFLSAPCFPIRCSGTMWRASACCRTVPMAGAIMATPCPMGSTPHLRMGRLRRGDGRRRFGDAVLHRGRSPGRAFSYEQRLFAVPGTLAADGPGQWQAPQEIVAADGLRYIADRQEITNPAPGSIKAFRDPAWFRDPATGQRHIVFTGSAA
jgi:levansucrase